MSVDEKNALVLAASVALAKQRTALARRGLDDLSKWHHSRARVLLVNDQRALLEEMEQILVTSGCDVRSTLRQADAIPLANAFFDERYGCSPKEFKAQFAMLGLTMPPILGKELYALDRRISKLIFWGELQDSEDLEQRRQYYDFELLPTPVNADKLLTQMTSWIAEAWSANGNLLDGKERHLEALNATMKRSGFTDYV